MAIDWNKVNKNATQKDNATYAAQATDYAKVKTPLVSVPKTSAPLVSAPVASTPLKSTFTPNTITNSLQTKLANVQPTMAKPVVSTNLLPEIQREAAGGKVVQPVQDKVTDTDVERGFYALGNVLAGDNANTVLGGLRYDLARGLGGVIGGGAGLVTQASGLVNQGLSALTSLGGTAPNAVSKWFDEGAKYALDRDVSGAMSAGIENSVEGKKNWSSNITGNLYETVGNIMTGKAAGGAISGFTKLAPEVASKLAMGLSAGGQGATNAYNEGATPQQAISFGNAVAGLEMATESMFGGVPGLGKGVFDDIIKGLKKSPTALKALVDMVGEGGEEVLSSFLTPYLQRILYNPEAKNATVNELLTSFAYGAGLSGLMQAPAVIGSIGAKPNIPSDDVNYTAQTGANNVQNVPNNMQNRGQSLTPNLPTATKSQPTTFEEYKQQNIAMLMIGKTTEAKLFQEWKAIEAQQSKSGAIENEPLPKVYTPEELSKIDASTKEGRHLAGKESDRYDISKQPPDTREATRTAANRAWGKVSKLKVGDILVDLPTALNGDFSSEHNWNVVSSESDGIQLVNYRSGRSIWVFKDGVKAGDALGFVNDINDGTMLTQTEAKSEYDAYASERPQQAVQAPVSDFKPQVATDTAKAAEVDTAEQVKPEAQAEGETQPTDENKPDEKIYYRGTSTGDTRRISTGNETWDNNLFVSKNEELAKAYGKDIEIIRPKPNAKILTQGTTEFNKLYLRQRQSENMTDFGARVVEKAKSLGYDIVEFSRQGDVGTVVINQDSVLRNQQRPKSPLFPSNSLGAKITKGMPQTTTDTEKAVEASTEQQAKPDESANADYSVLSKNRDGKDGWGEKYGTAMEAINDAIKAVNPQLLNAFESEAYEGATHTPIIDAVVAVQQDVRQDTITPMQAAEYVSRIYNERGVKGLTALFSPNTGNLYNNVLEEIKAEPTQQKSPSLFPSNSLGAKITKGMPQGTGAASKGSLGGIGATKPTRFAVNDELDSDLSNLPKMSNQVVMNPQSKTGNFKTNLGNAYTHIVNVLNPIVKFSKVTGDNTAMLASNSANAGGTVSHIFDNALVDMNGNKIGTSLKEIANKVPKGQEVEFWNYMMQRRNINKAVEDKNVIANFNSRMSAQYAKEVESRNPKWKSTGDEVVKWIADFEQAWGVNSGLIDQEFFNQLKLKDPNYVPAQREFTELESALTGGEVGKKFVDQRTPLKTMQGSERDINNPLENIMRLVNTTVKSARYNQVGQSLLKTIRSNPKASQYGEIVSEDEAKASRANNIVAVIENGQKQYIRINDIALLDALNGIPKSTYTVPVISNLTTAFKKITTQDNPLFGITNLARDLPTGYVYGSQWNPFTYLLNEGKAFGQIAKNGANYQRYKAVGGGMSSFFSSADAETAALNMNKTKNVFQKVGIGFNKFNSMIEEATRLNEFSAVLAKTGDVQKALNAANDVTVNFSRGGDVIKTVDRNGVPYLNASIQGIDKLAKAFTPERVAKTLLTGAIGITLPTLALYLFNRDNPYYDELSNRTKDTYFVIPNMFGEKDDNGNPMTFIKLPKSRELGIIFGALAERIARAVDGEEEAFKGFSGTLATNISPANPLDSGLVGPMIGLRSNKDFAGRTIVPQSMEDRSAHLQFDEKTSEITKFIAEYASKVGIELSPKQMDYLIDSWTGVVGDFLLPATTKGANALSPITNKFTADPRYSSQTITDFYDKMDEAAKKANDKNFAEGLDSETVTLEEKISSNYAKASKEISALSKVSARAGVEMLTGEDVELLKEYGIDTSAKPQDVQKAIRTEQNKIASAAISRGTKADEMELDPNNNSDIAAKVEKYQSAGITQKQAYDFYKSTADIDSNDKYSMVKLISGKGYTDTQAIALVGTLYTDSSKESMLPYLNTSKHLLSLYLTNKDSEMISMSVPATVTKDSIDYELTDKEKEAFRNIYANYFNSRVTNISTAEQVKSLRKKAFEAAKLAVIQSR